MINYAGIETLHQSEQGSSVLKIKCKDTGGLFALKLVGQVHDRLNKLIFRREVAALRKLNQFDDIVKIYDSSDRLSHNKKSGYGGILLELLDRQPFNLVNFAAFSDLEKIVICRNSAKAALHAHQCGILHRDIKPSNIMLMDDSSKIKMIDFGSSKLKTIVDEETTHRIFSVGYVAPEVAQGSEATEKSDIYSLGSVFHYIFTSHSPTLEQSQVSLEDAAIVPDMKELLIKMLEINPNDRIGDMQEVVDSLDAIIGKLNANAFNYWFHVDMNMFSSLKREFTIENSMKYPQFLSGFMTNEFSAMCGIYNGNDSTYEFIGNNLFMQCVFDPEKRLFFTTKIYEIPIDKRTKLQRIFGIIEGKRNFIGLQGTPASAKNDNTRLKVQLQNLNDERNSLDSKNRLFEGIFGKWRDSIIESLESIKEKCIQLEYNDFEFEQNKLRLSLESIQGAEIDSISQEIGFAINGNENGREKSFPIGNYEDYYNDGENDIMVLALNKNVAKSKLNGLLMENALVLEDSRRKTVALRRQLSAITALKNSDYNAVGLKDIILELSVPTSTSAIRTLSFNAKTLNDSQKNAINKAMYSNSISLIQGPPGTGKTSVITELIQQIIIKSSTTDVIPKILVVSQSHTAVDNILEKLSSWSESNVMRIVRIGKRSDVSESVAKQYLVDAIKDGIYDSIQTSSKGFVEDKVKLLSPDESDDTQSADSKKASLATWKKVQEIHDDWLKRCGDYNSLRYQIVNTSTIIAGTCIGFLSDENVRDMTFDYVIVDEAAKATTPELLVSILKAEKIVLVGDQNQLAPFADTSLSPLSVKLVKDPNFRIFDILYNSLPESHKQFLSTQYRMCSAIGNLISTVFYDGKIITGIDDKDRQHTIKNFIDKSIVWINTELLPNRDSRRVKGGSSYNQSEINIIRKLLKEMNTQEDAKSLDVGIITGYRAQKDHINKVFKNGDFKNLGNVDINTLDAFQGRENDIIIYSTVRTSGNIEFLQEKERVNVAFSRAKKLLIICGDMNFFATWTDPRNTFSEIIQYIRNNPDTCQAIDAQGVLR